MWNYVKVPDKSSIELGLSSFSHVSHVTLFAVLPESCDETDVI